MPNPPISSLVDLLHATTQDTTQWDSAANLGRLSFTTGGLVLSSPAYTPGNNSILSLNAYSLVGSQALIRVVNPGNMNSGAWTWHFRLCAPSDPTTGVGWTIFQGFIEPYVMSGGNIARSGPSAGYDPAVHKWLRVRESGGSVVFEAGPDNSSWPMSWTAAPPFAGLDLTALKVTVVGGVGSNPNVSSNSSATVDAVGGLAPPATSIAVSPAAASSAAPAPTSSISINTPAAVGVGDSHEPDGGDASIPAPPADMGITAHPPGFTVTPSGPGNQPMSTLQDPLHATTQDTTQWDAAQNIGHIAFTAGGLVCSTFSGTTGNNGIQSLNPYTLVGSQALARIVAAGAQSGTGDWQVHFRLCTPSDPTTGFGWMVYAGSIWAYIMNGGNFVTYNTWTYDTVNHKWFRMRESAGSVIFEAGPDNVSWPASWTYTPSVDLTALKVRLFGGAATSAPATVSATFDDVGGLPPQPPTFIDVNAAQATASAPAPTAVIKEPMAHLIDPLHATTQDTTQWDPAANAGSLAFTTGGLVLSSAFGVPGNNSILSLKTYTLVGSQAVVRVVNAGKQSGNWQFHFRLCMPSDPTTGFGWVTFSGFIQAYVRTLDNPTTTSPAVGYDPNVHKFLRIRESGGSVIFEAGPDNSSWPLSWTTTTVPPGLDLTALKATIIAGNGSSTTDTGSSATVDDVGGPSAPLATTIDVLAAGAIASAPAPVGIEGEGEPPAAATASAAAPTTSISITASSAGATAASPAPTAGAVKAIDAGTATATASASAPTLRVTSSVSPANASSTAPPPFVGLIGPPVNIAVGTAQSTATANAGTISCSASAPAASASSQARNWSQALSTNATRASATASAPAPTVTTFYSLLAPAANAVATAWPMTTGGEHVNVPGPPISAGRLVTTRTGVVARVGVGHVERPTAGHLVRA